MTRLWTAIAPRAITLLVVAASALGLLSFPIGFYDDSILLMGARLVAAGKTPYIDFYSHYGPFGYTVLSVLLGFFKAPGLALRIGEIALLAGLAVLLHILIRSFLPSSALREYLVAPIVLALSQTALEPSFFGFAFAVIGLVLFLLAQTASRALPAAKLAIAAGVSLAAAAMTRPGFAIYIGGALVMLEAAAGRMRTSRLPFILLVGSASLTAALMAVVLYPRIPLTLMFNAAVVAPGRLMSGGARYVQPVFFPGPVVGEIAGGAALAATTVAWAFAVERAKVRKVAATCAVAGSALPLLLLLSKHPARDAGLLALILFGMAGAVAFAGRRELEESAPLRAAAAFGLAAAAFGHYFWARADHQHLAPFFALGVAGTSFLPSLLRPASRPVVACVLLASYASTAQAFSFPAADVLDPDVVTKPLPWRCTIPRDDARRAVALADSIAEPGSRFVAVGTTQAWSSSDPVVLFLLSSRLPYTKWFQYDPGLQSSSAIQEEMERELEASGSRTAVVWRAGFASKGEDPRQSLTPFDEHFRRLYPATLSRIGEYEVRVRGASDAR